MRPPALRWALGASLILHTAAAAGFHFLFQPQAPEPQATRTVALVTLAHLPSRPETSSVPVAKPSPTPKPQVKPAPPIQKVSAPDAAPTPLAKPITPDPRRDAIPVFKSPPRRPAYQAMATPKPAPATVPAPAPAPPAQSEVAALAPLHPPGYGQPGHANARPRYPWLSRQKGEQGRVVLRVSVDVNGRATGVTVVQSSGFGRLDRAARRAIETWRFTPAHRGGRDVAGTVDVPVSFRLSDG